MYDHPDLEASSSLTTAAVKNIEWTVYQLQKGIAMIPDPLQHLEFGVAKVQMAYLDAVRQEAPEEVLENMRKWIELANHILNPPQDTVLPAPGASGVVNPSPPPGAMPMGGPSPLDIPVGPEGAPIPAMAVNAMGNAVG